MSRGGDWICSSCQHLNFQKREVCQVCRSPIGGGRFNTDVGVPNRVLAGDWYCNAINCGAHNYASRASCYRCGSTKHDHSSEASELPAGWKSGDWICTRYGCGLHNYASRMECYRCKTPRDFGGAV